MASFQPAEVFAPGEFLREELSERNWTQSDLARIIARPVQVINLIVTGKKAITATTARQFAAALGTSAELWLSLQTAYDLSIARVPEGEIRRRARACARRARPGGRYRSPERSSRHAEKE